MKGQISVRISEFSRMFQFLARGQTNPNCFLLLGLHLQHLARHLRLNEIQD
jgi:hypothetical protein